MQKYVNLANHTLYSHGKDYLVHNDYAIVVEKLGIYKRDRMSYERLLDCCIRTQGNDFENDLGKLDIRLSNSFLIVKFPQAFE